MYRRPAIVAVADVGGHAFLARDGDQVADETVLHPVVYLRKPHDGAAHAATSRHDAATRRGAQFWLALRSRIECPTRLSEFSEFYAGHRSGVFSYGILAKQHD